jgi:NADH-quinone oxidoreductase subunit I
MTDTYEFSEFQRENLVYDFVTLTPEERIQKKKNFEEMQAKKEAEKIAAAKKAAEEKAAQANNPAETKSDNKEENKQ